MFLKGGTALCKDCALKGYGLGENNAGKVKRLWVCFELFELDKTGLKNTSSNKNSVHIPGHYKKFNNLIIFLDVLGYHRCSPLPGSAVVNHFDGKAISLCY